MALVKDLNPCMISLTQVYDLLDYTALLSFPLLGKTLKSTPEISSFPKGLDCTYNRGKKNGFSMPLLN